jgi:hypothetical protein
MLEAMARAESRWGLGLKQKNHREACGPCPFCGGTDRFIVWADGGYWCRRCGKRGWMDENKREMTDLEKRVLKLEVKQRELEREQQEQKRRMTALETMARCKDHLRYHGNLTQEALDYWIGEGITRDTVDSYLLGFCGRCPTDMKGRASFTIPVINDDKLQNIRHRLAGSDKDKYRPHMAGLGSQLFNKDKLNGQDNILIVEGEKKSIVLDQFGVDSVAICGMRSFRKEWLPLFEGKEVVVALDPDAQESAIRLASIFHRGKVASLPCKIDDMLVKYYASTDDLQSFLRLARPVGREH